MVYVTYADLSTTIDIRRATAGDETTLKELVNAFASDWNPEDITLHGRPVRTEDFDRQVGDLATIYKGSSNKNLLIEKHK